MIVSGQSWHWIDPVAGAAKAAEVLRPGGRLAPFWNVFRPSAEVAEAFSAVHRRVTPGPLADMWARPALDGYSVLFARAASGGGHCRANRRHLTPRHGPSAAHGGKGPDQDCETGSRLPRSLSIN